MGQTCITLGKFHFTFWGLNRYHILRLFHLGKKTLPAVLSLPCTHMHLENCLAQLPVVRWKVKISGLVRSSEIPVLKAGLVARSASGRFSANAASTCQIQYSSGPLLQAFRFHPCHAWPGPPTFAFVLGHFVNDFSH